MSATSDRYIDEMNEAVETLARHLHRGEWGKAARFILYPNNIEPEDDPVEHLGVAVHHGNLFADALALEDERVEQEEEFTLKPPSEKDMDDMAEAADVEKPDGD